MYQEIIDWEWKRFNGFVMHALPQHMNFEINLNKMIYLLIILAVYPEFSLEGLVKEIKIFFFFFLTKLLNYFVVLSFISNVDS